MLRASPRVLHCAVSHSWAYRFSLRLISCLQKIKHRVYLPAQSLLATCIYVGISFKRLSASWRPVGTFVVSKNKGCCDFRRNAACTTSDVVDNLCLVGGHPVEVHATGSIRGRDTYVVVLLFWVQSSKCSRAAPSVTAQCKVATTQTRQRRAIDRTHGCSRASEN